jgi:hypothetical protein
MKHTNHKALALHQMRSAWLLAGLFAISSMAQATCNANIPLTHPDSRYEAVAGATPTGSEVRDKVTGLIWQRCVQGMSWGGSTCTGTATATSHSWTAALELARAATPSTVPVATAWRVPSHAELYSLAERACYNPAINTTWFPATPPDWTWSSSPIAKYTDSAWLVNFSFGGGNFDSKGSAYRVRLVRSGQ